MNKTRSVVKGSVLAIGTVVALATASTSLAENIKFNVDCSWSTRDKKNEFNPNVCSYNIQNWLYNLTFHEQYINPMVYANYKEADYKAHLPKPVAVSLLCPPCFKNARGVWSGGYPWILSTNTYSYTADKPYWDGITADIKQKTGYTMWGKKGTLAQEGEQTYYIEDDKTVLANIQTKAKAEFDGKQFEEKNAGARIASAICTLLRPHESLKTEYRGHPNGPTQWVSGNGSSNSAFLSNVANQVDFQYVPTANQTYSMVLSGQRLDSRSFQAAPYNAIGNPGITPQSSNYTEKVFFWYSNNRKNRDDYSPEGVSTDTIYTNLYMSVKEVFEGFYDRYYKEGLAKALTELEAFPNDWSGSYMMAGKDNKEAIAKQEEWMQFDEDVYLDRADICYLKALGYFGSTMFELVKAYRIAGDDWEEKKRIQLIYDEMYETLGRAKLGYSENDDWLCAHRLAASGKTAEEIEAWYKAHPDDTKGSISGSNYIARSTNFLAKLSWLPKHAATNYVGLSSRIELVMKRALVELPTMLSKIEDSSALASARSNFVKALENFFDADAFVTGDWPSKCNHNYGGMRDDSVLHLIEFAEDDQSGEGNIAAWRDLAIKAYDSLSDKKAVEIDLVDMGKRFDIHKTTFYGQGKRESIDFSGLGKNKDGKISFNLNPLFDGKVLNDGNLFSRNEQFVKLNKNRRMHATRMITKSRFSFYHQKSFDLIEEKQQVDDSTLGYQINFTLTPKNCDGTVAGMFPDGVLEDLDTLTIRYPKTGAIGLQGLAERVAVVLPKEAQIGDVKYKTFGEAFAAAKADQTIVLLKDVTSASALSVSNNVVIDCDGNTFVNTGTITVDLTKAGDTLFKNLGEESKLGTIVCTGKEGYEAYIDTDRSVKFGKPSVMLGVVAQRYPWNGKLDIGYRTSCMMDGRKATLKITINGNVATEQVELNFGEGQLVYDVKKAFGEVNVKDAKVTLELVK